MRPTVSLRLKLLGGFEARLSPEARVEIPTKKAQCLLAYLALHPGEAQSREKLIGLFWGDREEDRAQHSLRQALTYLRKSLEELDPSPLQADRNAVRLAPDLLEVDVLEMLRLTSRGEPEDLVAAVGLYRGDLLEGIAVKEPEFDAWLETERRHLREVFGQGLLSLVDLKRQSGDREEALRLAQHLLALDPLQERVHRALMALYGELGMREAALQQYERCRALLADDLGVEPEAETLALYETLRGNGQDARAASDRARPLAAEPSQVARPPAPSASWRSGLRRWALPGVVLSVLVLGIGLAWWRPWAPDVEPASLSRMAFPLPDGPSIAVLPFDNLGGDPAQDYFANGITDDLITDLSKVPGLFVIARNSTFVYKDEDVPIRQVAEDLGVRYVMEGSLRRAGDQVRINVQLIDATSGGHLWAERYDGPMADLLAFQDQVTRHVAGALEIKLTAAEETLSARQETANAEAYDSVLRALEHYRRYTREDLAIAVSYLEKAIRLDTNYARAHTLLGGVLFDVTNEEWERSFGLMREEVLEKARHHLEVGMIVPSTYGHFIQSNVHSNEGRYEDAISEAEKILELSPNDAVGYLALGRALNKAGRAPEALAPLHKAVRLDPRGDDTGSLSYRLGESLYLSGRFRDAAEAFRSSVDKNPNEWTYLMLAASLGQVGKLEEAGSALATFNRIRAEAGEDPYTVAHVEGWAFKEQADRERVQEGMRKAGVPEGVKTELDLVLPQNVAPADVGGATTIDVKQAKELFDRGIKMVDVRDQADWDDGHVPKSIHLSIFVDFTDAELSLVTSKDEEVIILGEGAAEGAYAAIAATRAVSWGYRKVYYFPAGFPGWKAAGFPIKVAEN